MRHFAVFTYEAKHFWRNKFKVFAWLLFATAGIFGLHNGAALYQAQMTEIAQIEQKAEEQFAQMLDNYNKGVKSPEGRPWVDYTKPFWAIWYLPSFHIKTPSAAMVYSTGQAEQYGYYKKMTVWAGPYDSDLAEEISNPERRQRNSLDFAFVVLFMLPLLLVILVYNLRSSEAEQGLLPLVLVQSPNARTWLLARLGFYVALVGLLLVLLIGYGAILNQVSASTAVGLILVWVMGYLAFWSLLFWGILTKVESILESTLKMIGLWLLLSFIIPGLVHQYVSIQYPPNLMLDLIDVQRDGREKLFEQPDSLIDAQLFDLMPALAQTKLANDSSQRPRLRNFSASALANAMVKEVTSPIAQHSQAKNQLIRATYWFNPVSFFQNQLNWASETHFEHYEQYRQQLQSLVDKRIALMAIDMWNDVEVDQARFEAYHNQLNP